MPATTRHGNDDYWTDDTFLFQGTFQYYHHEPRQVRGLVHTSEEEYETSPGDTEIIEIPTRKGKRTYVQLHPYVLERRMVMTMLQYPHPTPDHVIGEVLSSEVSPDRPVQARKCGEMQGWYYGADHIFALWDCILDRYVRDRPLEEDENMPAFWQGVERWILQQFPQTQQVITPFRERIFPDDQYQAFLGRQGYAPVSQAAWGKRVTSENTRHNG